MKKLIYIFALLLIVSCRNEMNKAMDTEALAVEALEENDNNITSDNYKYAENETFEFKELTAQKLQEFYDLSILKNQHPEFKEAIELQLKNFTDDSQLLSKVSDSVSIKNIQFITEDFKASDAIQKVKIKYDLVLNKSIIKDSIYAEITSEDIILDGKVNKSTKLKFTKE